MNAKFLKMSIIMLFSLTFIVLCLSDKKGLAGRAGSSEEEGGEWYLTWRSYEGVTIDIDNVERWHEDGTELLQTDDDEGGYDVSVEATLICTGLTPGWECDEGTAEVTEDWEVELMAEKMAQDGFDCLVINSIEIDEEQYLGYCCGDKIFIITDPAKNTLVHEVGHLADLYDIDLSGEEERIMYKEAEGGNKVRTNCPINGDEREAYEVGKPPPEK